MDFPMHKMTMLVKADMFNMPLLMASPLLRVFPMFKNSNVTKTVSMSPGVALGVGVSVTPRYTRTYKHNTVRRSSMVLSRVFYSMHS